MELILLQKINKLGSIGDVVSVKSGFARNYLLPSGKALRATKENVIESKALRKETVDNRSESRKNIDFQIAAQAKVQKAIEDHGIEASISKLKDNRLSSKFLFIISSNPGSYIGIDPELSLSILFLSTSVQITLFPNSDMPAPVTKPT